MNQLVVSIIIILFPGIIAAVISDKITVHAKWNSFKFALYSIVLGILSYTSVQLLFYVFDLVGWCSTRTINWSHLDVWNGVVNENPTISPWEVVMATSFSGPVAFAASAIINRKYLNKFAQFLKVSTKYGDENLYSYYLNAKEIEWVYIRDVEKNLTYQGSVVSYSENDHIQEIVLSNVTVFRYEDSAELYSVPSIYLAKEIGKFTIEAIPNDRLGAANGEETTD